MALIKELNSFLSKTNDLLNTPSAIDLLQNSQPSTQQGTQSNAKASKQKGKGVKGTSKNIEDDKIDDTNKQSTNSVSLDDDVKNDNTTSNNDNWWLS